MDPVTLAYIGGTVVKASEPHIERARTKKQRAEDKKYNDDWKHYEIDQARKDRDYENWYNDPAQQMERLRQAGLSPHLVYGKGADMASATTRNWTGNSVTPTDVAPTELPNPAEIFGGYQSLKLQQAQTDNLNQQVETSKAQQLLTEANTAKVAQDTAKGKFELEQAQDLRDLVIEKAKLANQKTSQDISRSQILTDIAQDTNIREDKRLAIQQELAQEQAKTMQQNRDESVQRVLNLQVDNEIKTLQKHLTNEEWLNVKMKYDRLKAEIKKAEESGELLRLQREAEEAMGKNTNQTVNWILRALLNK